MKLRFIILIVLFGAMARPALSQQANGPLTKTEVMSLVKFGLNSADLAKKIRDLGIDFEPTDDYLQSLRQAGASEEVVQALRTVRPKPLTQEQVGKLVAGGVPNQRAAALVQQHGIDFLANEEYLKALRLAGADNTVIDAVRAASAAAMGEMEITTSANAEVSLDGAQKGLANNQGELTVKAPLGAHRVKVTLAGKRDFEQTVSLTSLQAIKIEARLTDLRGRIVIQTAPAADVFMDGTRLGNADGAGQLVIPEAAPGSHELRISASGKREYRQSVGVNAGQETRVEALLADLIPAPSAASYSATTRVAGTTWTGTDVDGDYYEYTFQEDGVLSYKTPSGTYTNGTWKQEGNSIYMETNHKYSERQGTIMGDRMEGKGWNIKGHHWTWKATKKL